MKKTALLTAIFLSSFLCFSQSSEKITEILDAEKATYGHVAYLFNTYSNPSDEKSENATFEESFNELKKSVNIKEKFSASDEISLSQASLIFALATNMKGGIWYSIKPSARYALREAKSRKLIPENADPSKKISGHDALDLFSCFVTEFTESKGNEK